MAASALQGLQLKVWVQWEFVWELSTVVITETTIVAAVCVFVAVSQTKH